MTEEPRRGRSLSRAEITFLIESGAFTPAEFGATSAAVARGELADLERRTRQAALEATWSAKEVATHLRTDLQGVNQRRVNKGLFSIDVENERRYPAWQFTNNADQPVLPGIELLVAAFPHDMHPASILGFMSTPQDSARIDGLPTAPVEWLVRGGDPQVLKRILESFLMS